MAGPSDKSISPASPGVRWSRLVVWLLIIAALVAGFAQNFAEMWTRWFPAWKHTHWGLYERFIGGQSYYTHGPVVPLVSLIIFLLLVRFTKVPVRPRPVLGFLVLVPSVLLHLVSCLARVNFASCFALIGVLAGIILILWGTTALRRLWFPLAFLAFMVPLPEVSIAQLNFRLKIFAADWGVRAANVLGIIAERSGNRVFLQGDKALVIANVCNGLRTLITVIGFGALYTYVCRLRGIWRLVLFLMSVPVALVANSIRIVGLIVVADIWDEKVATGWFHDMSGAMIFLLAFLMMFGLERVFLWIRTLRGRPVEGDKLFRDVRRGPEDEGQASKLFGAAGMRRSWVLVVLVTLSAGGALWLNRAVVPEMWNREIARGAMPQSLNIGGVNWHSYDLKLDEGTLDVLETQDYLCRRYVRPGTPHMEFSIIFSGDNRKGTHPPDLCLAGAGEGIVAKGALLVDVKGPGAIEFRELIIASGSVRQYFLYVYKCGSIYTSSFWKQQLVILLNGLTDRNASGALIRLSTPVIGDDLDDARRRSSEFLRVAMPYLDKGLP